MPIRLSLIHIFILASGRASRFGENKLLHPIDGKPMIEKLFSSIPSGLFEQVIVVSIYSDILTIARKYGYVAVQNEDTTDDIAKTIALGMAEIDPLCRGCMFFVSDQPWLTTRTIQELAAHFCEESEKIHVPLCNGKQGNPEMCIRDRYQIRYNAAKRTKLHPPNCTAPHRYRYKGVSASSL